MPRFIAALSILAALILTGALPARAQQPGGAEPIGKVVGLTPAVEGPRGRLQMGSPVYENDTITTGPSGVIELMFLDNTHLVIGSRSQVVLDKFVYDAQGKAKVATFRMTTGAFRFLSGDSPKKAYKVNTPTAAIGVRGTKFDVGLRPSTSRITIFEGRMRVCPPRRPLRYCKYISKPGETALVQNGVVTIVGDGVVFSEHCTGSAESRLCDLFGRRP